MDFPSLRPGTFKQYDSNTPSATYWGGQLFDATGQRISGDVEVLKPTNPELKLTYTTLVGYNYLDNASRPFGWAAFGTATAAGSVPISGSATYGALIRGSSIDGNGLIQGTASLAFDYGAGKLSGHFDPVYFSLGGIGETYKLARYDFTSTVYSSGSTTFSGQLSTGSGPTGSFSGQFTGPAAQELMATWSAPFRDPLKNIDSTMFGVLAGAK